MKIAVNKLASMLLFWLTCSVLTAVDALNTTSALSCHPNDVLWLWKGALTSSSVTFKFGLRANHSCRNNDFIFHAFPELHADEKPHSTIATCNSVGDGSAPVKECAFTSLPHSNRVYTYQLSLVSTTNIPIKKGTFQTPPAEGEPFNFRFAFSSCVEEASNATVFDDMKQANPFFFLHMGDFHYHDIDKPNVTLFREAYNSQFASPPGQAMLGMDVPFAYIWDDHDFGPNDGDNTAPGRNQSAQAYREFVPHYPLAATDKGAYSAIYQAFTIGRIRFVLTDLRSQRTPNQFYNVPSKSTLGAKQKQWLKDELVLATQDPSIGLIIWCSTMPWNNDETKWGYYRGEQRELVEFMQTHGINRSKKVVIVSGDAHMLAVDDGRFSPGNITVFQAASLGRPGSIKGGPYSHGVFPGSGQYGIMDVRDDGKQVCLYYQGIRTGTGVLIEYDTCHPEQTPPNSTYYPPPIPIRQVGRAWKKLTTKMIPGTVTKVNGWFNRWFHTQTTEESV